MQYSNQPPRRPQNGSPRPQQSRPQNGAPRPQQNRPQNGSSRPQQSRPPQNPQPNPQRIRRDATAEYARRKAAYERQVAERRRQEAMRKRRIRVFWGRVVVFFVILLLLAIIACVGFAIYFNHSDPPSEPTAIRYTYNGDESIALPEDLAYANEILYVDFSDLATRFGLVAVGGADEIRFVIPSSEPTDSDGNGSEEDVIFRRDSDLATVNGQDVRLSGNVRLWQEHFLVPATFLTEYMQGISFIRDGNTVDIARTYTEEIPDTVAFTLKRAAVVEPLPEDTELGDIDPDEVVPSTSVPGPAEEDLVVSFLSDLSAYEEYMNPADRDGYLILVNNDNTIDETYLPTDLTDLADTRKDGRNVQQMRLYAAKALEALYIEMRAAGYKDVSVTSAYRSYSYQNSLFNMYTANEMKADPSLTLAQAQAITATYSARPGTSEHQTGLCCDMHNLGAADVAFAKKEAYTWLTENAWKFGFILRFPQGKEDITGISFEPWHYRYVGRYHAKAIHDAGLCLEEYLTPAGN